MRLGSLGVRTVAIAGGLVSATTCQLADALKPAAIRDIALAYASDSVLVVAAPVAPQIRVTVDGAALPGARLRFESSDTETVAVRGDTLVPKRRGTATLTVTLESSALSQNPPSLTRALWVVADTVTLDSTAVRLTSLGDTVTLVATARDALGATLAGVTARWSSSDTTVVALAPPGRLTAKGNGTVAIRAMVDRDTAVVTVTVAQQLTHWTFDPASLHIEALSDTASVVATGHDPRGNPIAGLGPSSWSVGDATVATPSGTGQVTSVRNGATFLYVARGSVRDSVAISVAQRATSLTVSPRPVPAITSLGAQTQLTARAFDGHGVEIQAAAPVWFTLDAGRVRVSSDGLVTALATGTARVGASLDAGADTATVTITNDPATVTVSPDSAVATSLGDTLVFHAVARNGRGDSIAATVSWRTPDSTVVNLLADGRAIALAVGAARLIATVGGKADTGLAKVTNVPTAIEITPTTRTYTSVGDVDTLPVTVTNARGGALPRGAVTWSSDDATIARVSSSGVVTAKDTGQTVVRASSGLVMDSVVVTVENLPASIVVNNPSVDTLTAIGQTLTLPADVRNARGTEIVNYPVAWHSTNRTVVDTVRPTGDAVAIGWGTTSLIAQAGPAADTLALTVRSPTRLYVSNTVFTGLRVGTLARPYGRIQDAVAAAGAGDTVIVLRGISAYSEDLNLARRVTILGDSAAFIAGGRNPALLPLLAHDTGAAAITANTTAPVTVNYLAIRHTLDGPAFASDGSDVQLAWVYVNPPGSVTSRIGRGVSIANSLSGTTLRNLHIFSVRGYGISLIGSSAALISGDSVVGVDSVNTPERGAGIALSGGSGVTISANVVRGTRGPRILVRGAASATIQNEVLSGKHPLIQLDSVTGLVQIQSNVFQVGYDPTDNADSPDCSVDTRCAGILITNSRNGALVGGVGYLAYTSPAEITANTFTDAGYRGTTDGVGIRVRRSMAHGTGNAFRYVATAHLLEGASKGYFTNATADTTGWLAVLANADSIYLAGATTHEAGVVSHTVFSGSNPTFIQISGGTFSLRTGGLITVWDTGTEMLLEDADLSAAPNNQPIVYDGKYLTLDRVRVTGVGDTVPGYTAGAYYSAGVMVMDVSFLSMHASRIEGFTYLPGLSLVGAIGSFSGDSNVISRNQLGVYVHSTVPAALALQGSGNNAVFDNVLGGLEDTRGGGSGLPQWWWGDGRGPRGGTDPTATGDSVLDAPVAQTLFLPAPPLPGAGAAQLRPVRGAGQTAPANTALPKAFTVRAVDAAGLPVAGVAVTFTVTSGGGTLGGQTTRTVTTNADGLAEALLLLGPVAGGNAVTATAPGLGAGVTFTATGN